MVNSSFPSIEKSVIEPFSLPQNTQGHNLFILRDDLIHPFISGNKWRKLQYIINEVKKRSYSGVISYGGAFSNHLVATASACKLFNIPCILYVRGDELCPKSNPYLTHCDNEGATLRFLTRQAYNALKHQEGEIQMNNQLWYSVPEGGACSLGLKGCMEMLTDTSGFDIIALAQGTTTTSLGLLLNAKPTTKIWGFPVLKGFDSFKEMENLAKKSGLLQEWERRKNHFHSFNAYHFNGYAKQHSVIHDRLEQMDLNGSFKFDPVYTGKAFIGMVTELKNITTKCNVLFIHTGGVLPL